jgi:hypothetical protein
MITTFCGEQRFKYWPDAKLVDIDDTDTLIETYISQPGEHHYFDDETMDFFGTEDFHMIGPGISVEYQSNAPEGLERWTIVCWVLNDEDNVFRPYTLCRHWSLSEASICGHVSCQQLNNEWSV